MKFEIVSRSAKKECFWIPAIDLSEDSEGFIIASLPSISPIIASKCFREYLKKNEDSDLAL